MLCTCGIKILCIINYIPSYAFYTSYSQFKKNHLLKILRVQICEMIFEEISKPPQNNLENITGVAF